MKGSRSFSIVIPIFNEEDSITPLIEEIWISLQTHELSCDELFIINDGSTDSSWRKLNELREQRSEIPLHLVNLRKRSGKAVALAIGFQKATSELIITLDGDGQDAPENFPALIQKIEEGYDLVSGWKHNRKDPLSKIIPSYLFNFILRRFTRLPLHDFNCGLKIYRRDAVQSLKLYGDLHRYIPVFLYEAGFKVCEVQVLHRPRIHGHSKYGGRRFITGLLDLISLVAIIRFFDRPGQFFGTIGVALGAIGFLILSYLTALWCLDLGPIGTRPLFFLGIMCVLLSAQFILFGTLAEVIYRQLFQDRSQSLVKSEISPSCGSDNPPA